MRIFQDTKVFMRMINTLSCLLLLIISRTTEIPFSVIEGQIGSVARLFYFNYSYIFHDQIKISVKMHNEEHIYLNSLYITFLHKISSSYSHRYGLSSISRIRTSGY